MALIDEDKSKYLEEQDYTKTRSNPLMGELDPNQSPPNLNCKLYQNKNSAELKVPEFQLKQQIRHDFLFTWILDDEKQTSSNLREIPTSESHKKKKTKNTKNLPTTLRHDKINVKKMIDFTKTKMGNELLQQNIR
ncbi:hypothetical protein ACOSP7_022954 [Xanthoceras sorbifolium]